MMLCGTPNLKMIDLMKFTAVRAVELVIGTASIHLVNLSTATSRCVRSPFEDFLCGPTMLSPHKKKEKTKSIHHSSYFVRPSSVRRRVRLAKHHVRVCDSGASTLSL